MAETALLTAIVILMAFTPLGYLRIGITQITFIVVPVAVGAVLLGPKAGAFLGLVFGIIPWQTIVVTIVPRILVGLVPAFLFKGLNKVSKKRSLNAAISCLVAPLTNTILFLGFMAFFLRDFMIAQYPDIYGVFAGKGFWAFYGAMFVGVALNIVLEAASCLIIATAICNALWHTVNK